MPIVPMNTISKPSGVRLPDVGMAKPEIAQAMGKVTDAMGRRAGAIGRLADTAGQQARAIGDHFGNLMDVEKANASGQQAKYRAIEGLGGAAMNMGMDLDRIYERKSQEQAAAAITEYTDYLNGAANGAQDPKTGERIPGTLDTPYSPGNEMDEATGPTVATAKSIKAWMENEKGTYAKMSPRAKQEFDVRAARVSQSVMDRAERQEYDQIQQFRQANNKAAFEADRKLLANLAVDVTPQGEQAWQVDMMAAHDAQIMREIGRYQKDPSNQSVKNAEWSNPEVAKYAGFASRNLMETYVADRASALLAAAQAEPDDARRETLLERATATAGMELSGQRILSEEAVQKTKLDAEKVRDYARSMKAQQAQIAIADADQKIEAAWNAGTPESEGEMYDAIGKIPSVLEQQKRIVGFQQDKAAVEIGRFKHFYAQSVIDPANHPQEEVVRAIEAMKSPEAKLAALEITQGKGQPGAAGAAQEAAKHRLSAAITLQGSLGKDPNTGELKVNFDSQATLRKQNIDALRKGEIDYPTWEKNHNDINKLTPADQVLVERAVKAAGRILGRDIVDGAILMQDGVLYKAIQKDGPDKGKPVDDLSFEYFDQEYVRPDGKRKMATTNWRNNPIKVDSDAFLALVKLMVEHQKANLLPDAKGDVKSLDQIAKEYMRPENRPVEVDEANRLQIISAINEDTKKMQIMQSRYIEQVFTSPSVKQQ